MPASPTQMPANSYRRTYSKIPNMLYASHSIEQCTTAADFVTTVIPLPSLPPHHRADLHPSRSPTSLPRLTGMCSHHIAVLHVLTAIQTHPDTGRQAVERLQPPAQQSHHRPIGHHKPDRPRPDHQPAADHHEGRDTGAHRHHRQAASPGFSRGSPGPSEGRPLHLRCQHRLWCFGGFENQPPGYPAGGFAADAAHWNHAM